MCDQVPALYGRSAIHQKMNGEHSCSVGKAFRDSLDVKGPRNGYDHSMSDISSRFLARTHLQHIRTEILVALDREYPGRLNDELLHSLETLDSPGVRTIRRELHYLEEKDFITIKKHEGKRISATITARGRDLVMGEFDEVGIAPVSDNYTGT